MDDFKDAIRERVKAALAENNEEALAELARELGRLQAQVQKARQQVIGHLAVSDQVESGQKKDATGAFL